MPSAERGLRIRGRLAGDPATAGPADEGRAGPGRPRPGRKRRRGREEGSAIKKVGVMYSETRIRVKPVRELGARVEQVPIPDPKGLKILREALESAMLARAPADGDEITARTRDRALGVGGADGGPVCDRICAKAIDGSASDM